MLEIKSLSKTYKGKTEVKALKNVSINLDNGVYALLGPNGAGKSTLMKILTLSLKPDSGEIFWDNVSIETMGDDYRAVLGYMPQQQSLYNTFTGKMFLNYIATLKNVPKNEIESQVKSAAESVNMQDKLTERIKNYSGGMKQRLLLASAALGDPKFVILDEPTAGLDPKERIRVRNLAHDMGENAIVLFATHVVSDIESIADKVIIMNKGVILAEGKPQELIASVENAKTLEDVYMHFFGNVEKEKC